MILMQMSVEGPDGRRICMDVDIDPQTQANYEHPLAKRLALAILQLLPHAVPSEPPTNLYVPDTLN